MSKPITPAAALSIPFRQRYFGEKSPQFTHPGTLMAFGIELVSRYHNFHELIAMLNFTYAAAKLEVATYVTRLFYDSKSTWCTIETVAAVSPHDPVCTRLIEAGHAALCHFRLQLGPSLMNEEFGPGHEDADPPEPPRLKLIND